MTKRLFLFADAQPKDKSGFSAGFPERLLPRHRGNIGATGHESAKSEGVFEIFFLTDCGFYRPENSRKRGANS
jgi:hypothetical protein